MKKTGKTRSLWKNGVRWVLIVLCGLITGVNVYLANANRLVGDPLPMPFGYGAAVVLSGSMEPTFSKGDLLLVEEAETYAVHDIVVFQDGNSLVVHRIIDIDGDTVTTQGDANNVADAPIDTSRIKGRVLGWIPLVGHVIQCIKTPLGTVIILAAAIALLEIPRRNEKRQDDEARQKLLDEIERLKQDL